MSAIITPPLTGARLELRLLRGVGLALVAVAVPTLAVAAALHGLPGAAGAAAGLGMVAVLVGLSGAFWVWSGHLDDRAAVGVMVGGLGLRVLCYLLGLVALSGVDSLHRPSLALATVVASTTTLVFELRLLHRTPQLHWVRASGETRSP